MADLDQYLTSRQAARFSQMSSEVKGMLGRNTGVENPNTAEERKGLRKGGYNQAEEDAMMNVFNQTLGRNEANLSIQPFKPSFKEGEVVDPGNAVFPDAENKANPPTPRIDAPDTDKFLIQLLANAMAAGREPIRNGLRSLDAGHDI